MILALAEAKGFQGLREKEILGFRRARARRHSSRRPGCSRRRGRSRILAFSPLFLLSQESFDFLCRRILEFVGQFHEKHPESRGVAVEKIAKRFELPETVVQLALKHLLKSGAIQVLDDIVALADFKVPLSPAGRGHPRGDGEDVLRGKVLHRLPRGRPGAVPSLPGPPPDALSACSPRRRRSSRARTASTSTRRWLDEIVRQAPGVAGREISRSPTSRR